MDTLSSIIFLGLVATLVIVLGISIFFVKPIFKQKSGIDADFGEKPCTTLVEFEQTQLYLDELENLPNHNQNKFLSVVKKHVGRDYMRALYLDNISRNLFLIILILGSSILSFALIFGDAIESIPVCAIPFTLFVLSSITYLIRSHFYFRGALEGEIRRAYKKINGWYGTTRNHTSPTFPSRVVQAQSVRVDPLWQQSGYSRNYSPTSSVASEKPKSGGCSLTTVLLILTAIMATLAIANLFNPDFIRDFVSSTGLSENSIVGCPKSFTDQWIVHKNTCDPMSAGVTKPGYQFCDVTARNGGGGNWSLNGTNMKEGALSQKWVLNACIY